MQMRFGSTSILASEHGPSHCYVEGVIEAWCITNYFDPLPKEFPQHDLHKNAGSV